MPMNPRQLHKESEVTDQKFFHERRKLVKAAVAVGLLPAGTAYAKAIELNRALSTTDQVAEKKVATGYNNFYEFGTDKSDPAKNSGSFRARPWSLTVDGEAKITGTFDLDDLLAKVDIEDRIYRLRCVEAWSMVLPWRGFELAGLLTRFKPTSKAKYVVFETLYDPKQMPGQRYRLLDWPYREGLRIDEAMHPLAFMATGIYGEDLPAQNGAPLRLVVPWKYGFKSIKSIVRISFVERMPATTWALMAPNEYGFYANVNPKVDHPRWSQASERVLGAGFSVFGNRRDTEMFNGYEEQVASLYKGMDLRRNY